jgi:hypothetical protein
MRAILAFITLFLAYVAVRAADINAASASRADVLTAYNSASDGDRIFVPAGSNNWSSAITVSKQVQIIGAGTNSTFLVNTTSASSGLETPLFELNAKNITISKFYFADQSLNWDSSAIQVASDLTRTNIVISSNLFNGFRFALVVNDAWGLSFSNHFLNNRVNLRHQGFNNTNEFDGLGQYPPFSWTNTYWFVMEDNWIQYNVSFGSATYMADTEFPTRYMFRHNTIDMADLANVGIDGFDMHGNLSSTFLTGVGYAIYKNTVNKTSGNVDAKWTDTRGGANSLIYSNTFTGDAAYMSFRNDPGTGPLMTNTFAWQNHDDSGDGWMDFSDNNGVTQGTHYYTNAPAGYDATKILAYPHPWRSDGGGGGGSSSGAGKSKPGQGKGRRR